MRQYALPVMSPPFPVLLDVHLHLQTPMSRGQLYDQDLVGEKYEDMKTQHHLQ
eukprot:Gb_06264 [translate_table: standard]